MAIRTIDEIEIRPPINFGSIYNFNLNINPTTDSVSLSVNIVNERGIYPIETIPSGYLFPYEIIVFGQFRMFMYLTSHSEHISDKQKTLSLEFEDGSHILNRIKIVLMDIDVPSTSPDGQVLPYINQAERIFTKKVLCDSCEGGANYTRYIGTKVDKRIIKSSIGGPIYNPLMGVSYPVVVPPVPGGNFVGNNQQGGFILLGTEEYVDSTCEVPKIIYNFQDLKIAASRIGVDINIPNYFQNYSIDTSDTLKNILQHFGGKFGIAPWYNFTKLKPTVEYTDLKTNTTYLALKRIKEEIKNLKSLSSNEPVVLSIEDTESKKGTYKQFVSLSARVSSEFKTEVQRELNYKTKYKAIKLSDLFTNAEMGGRTAEQVLISSYLNEADTVYRTLYNLTLRGRGTDREEILKVCGFTMLLSVEPEERKKVFLAKTQNVTSTVWMNMLKSMGIKDPKTGKEDHTAYDLYIGNYSELQAMAWKNWEKKVFNFLGKHFLSTAVTTHNEKVCLDPYFSTVIEQQMTPPGEDFYKNKDELCPAGVSFKDMLKTPHHKKDSDITGLFSGKEFVRIYSRGDATFVPSPGFIGSFLQGRFNADPTVEIKKNGFIINTKYLIEWLCEKSTGLTVDKTVPHPFDNFKPAFIPLDLKSIHIIFNSIKNLPEYHIPGSKELEALLLMQKVVDKDPSVADLSLHLALVPSNETLKKIMSVSSIYYSENPKETKAEEREKLKAFQAEPCPPNKCELEKSPNSFPLLVDGPCPCPPMESLDSEFTDPSKKKHEVGPDVLLSPSFNIKFRKINGVIGGLTIPIVFPFGTSLKENEYWKANYNEKITKKAFLPGFSKVLNDLGPAGDVSEIKLTHEDVSSVIFKDFESDKASTSLLLQSYFSGQLISFEEYFAYLKLMSDQGSLFPQKTLSISCAGSKFGSLFKYMNPSLGFKGVKISFDNDGAKFSLDFESRPAKVPDIFMTLFKSKMNIEKSQKLK